MESPASPHRPWTRAEEQLLIELRAAGVPNPEIARRHLPHRTARACVMRMKHLRTRGLVPAAEQRDPGVPDDAFDRRRIARGSARLRDAILAYYRRHHPDSPLGRRAA